MMSAFSRRMVQPWGVSRPCRQALQLEANRAREYDDENPTVLDRVEHLQQRLETVDQKTTDQPRQQDQGMEY